MKVDDILPAQPLTEELQVNPELAAKILAESETEGQEIDCDELIAIFEADLAALEADGGKEEQ